MLAPVLSRSFRDADSLGRSSRMSSRGGLASSSTTSTAFAKGRFPIEDPKGACSQSMDRVSFSGGLRAGSRSGMVAAVIVVSFGMVFSQLQTTGRRR